ncbi:MAG: diacylglycerol kinase family protein [Actinomycetia bacterium]|nr:diacylglycerol kinase family protein [Actinomycetes bacterium]
MEERRERLSWLVAASWTGLFGLWTVLAAQRQLDSLDRALAAPWLDPVSTLGQVLSAFSLVSHPVVTVAVVLGIAGWAYQRRLRRLAGALVGASFGWVVGSLVKAALRHPRVPSPFDQAISYNGYAYPSNHMVEAMILTVTVLTIATAARRSALRLWLIRTGGGLFLLAVAADRWLMRHHTVSQVIGGSALGAAVVYTALLLAGEHTIAESLGMADRPREHVDKRAAIIYNPAKVPSFDLFRKRVEYELRHRGWKPPLWLETEIDDPGYQMARDAIAKQADLVLVAGGDGTVRVVCSELVGTQIPVGLIPAGTGNLFARNLGVSRDEQRAFEVAFSGQATPVDVVRFTTDDRCEHFLVMSGMGVDAKVMSDTRPELKKLVGSAAYFLAAAQQLGAHPYPVTVTVDGGEPLQRSALLALVGNVGTLQGGIRIFPSATADDGLLDVLIGSPTSVTDWAKVASGLLGGAQVEPLEYAQGRHVVFEVDDPVEYQLDGDAAGRTRRFEAEVVPGGLTVMLPR